jgi:DNA polymerase-1
MAKALVFDFETDSLDCNAKDVVGVAYSVVDFNSQEVPVILYENTLSDTFKKLVEDKNLWKIAYNIKFEYQKLCAYGLKLNGNWFDPMIALWLCQKGVEKEDKATGKLKLHYGLKEVASNFLGYGDKLVDFKQLSKQYSHKNGRKFVTAKSSEIPESVLSEYCKKDVEMTIKATILAREYLKTYKQEKLFYNVEMPIAKILAHMEMYGVRINIDYLSALEIKFENELLQIEQQLRDVTKADINWKSSSQLSELLFNTLNLPVIEKTPKGEPSTSIAVIKALEGKHPCISLILKHRELSKLISTYIQGWLNDCNRATERIHFNLWQTGTDTGRLSSDGQQTPKKSETGLLIRKAIIPEDNYTLISADFSQMDLRILAHHSQDKELLYAFNNDIDLHDYTAKLLNIERGQAKAVNFGLVYGKSVYGFAKDWNISEAEAQKFLNNYFDKFNGVKEWMKKQIRVTRELGYTSTLLGRRRLVSKNIKAYPKMVQGRKGMYDVNKFDREAAERTALNSPIQGGTADVTKLAMIACDKILKIEIPLARLLLQIHDEIWFEVPKDEKDNAIAVIKFAMENCIKLNNVPIKANVKEGI